MLGGGLTEVYWCVTMTTYSIIEGCILEELEVWVEGYEGEYSVSTTGVIYSHKWDRKTALSCTVSGKSKSRYKSVTLSKNNKAVTRYIHRLVAQAFIDNPENKLTVNHINGDKLNNNVKNLEWATLAENASHAWVTGLCEPVRITQEEKDSRALQLISNRLSKEKFEYFKQTASLDVILKEGIPSNIFSVRNPQQIPLKVFWESLRDMCEDFMSDMTNKELEVKYSLTKSGVSRIRNKNRALEMWDCYAEWLKMVSEENNFKESVDSQLSVL